MSEHENDEPQVSEIVDLTVEETKTENVKGGISFGFGVEREMKESGEKGGTN